MDGYTLKLVPVSKNKGKSSEINLDLHFYHGDKSEDNSVNISDQYVFREKPYMIEFSSDSSEEIYDLEVYINEEKVEIRYQQKSHCIQFVENTNDENKVNVYKSHNWFNDLYGVFKISLRFYTDTGFFEIETDYVHIMVKKGDERFDQSVNRMVEYISSHDSVLLNNSEVPSRVVYDLKDSSYRTIESKIILLKKVILTLEKQYSRFLSDSKFKTIPEENVDSFEKLQYVSFKTIQYIANHPEYLRPVKNRGGIRINKGFYQPNKTLVTSSVQSFDTYENRHIIGFIKTILRDISMMEADLDSIISDKNNKPIELDDYRSSFHLMYEKVISSMKTSLFSLKQLQQRCYEIFYSYSRLFNVDTKLIASMPKPTHIFISIPHYRQVYNCMDAWFNVGIVNLDSEKYILSMNKISMLYESYVLLKILNFFSSCDYKLYKSYKKKYILDEYYNGKLYTNTLSKNCFVLKKGDKRVTVYYQPVIFSKKESVENESIEQSSSLMNFNKENEECKIGLFRNTSMPASKPKGTGLFYTPDYLVKYESDNSVGAKYLIADAKFSELSTVRREHVKNLAFKYLFSVSPLKKGDSVVSLCLINGLSTKKRDEITQIYNFAPNPEAIVPNANILTLTENEGNTIDYHISLMRKIFGKYM